MLPQFDQVVVGHRERCEAGVVLSKQQDGVRTPATVLAVRWHKVKEYHLDL